MISREYIETVIKKEIRPENQSNQALELFQQLVTRKNSKQLVSVFEISKILGGVSETKEIYQIAFKLANLSIPVFSILIEFEDDHSRELIEDDYSIFRVLEKKTLMHPEYGYEMTFSEYKDYLHFLFKLNDVLQEGDDKQITE